MRKASIAKGLLTLFIAGVASSSFANSVLEEITIIGDALAQKELAGSGAVIESEQLRLEVATDINQILKTVPGVYIREEEGFGLRPNIGIRGATAERSARILLLEDGVPIAPAPYAAPAAYYFPTLARMSSVEVLKGVSMLTHGPQSTGGALNLISTPLPTETGGSLRASLGSFGSSDTTVSYGIAGNELSAIVEATQRHSDGFKSLDGDGSDTGFDIADYLVKVGWMGDTQQLLFKAQYSSETSNETYTGLSDRDFAANANRRYRMTALDQMDNHHASLSLRHFWQISDSVELSSEWYRNDFARDWYKLGNGATWIDQANAGDDLAAAILHGDADVAGLYYKHNNREYLAEGVRLAMSWLTDQHTIELSSRWHDDRVDRWQPSDIYDQVNGELIFRESVSPSGSNNRLEGATAQALALTDAWQVNDRLRLDLALRRETVKSFSNRFADVARDELSDSRRNRTQVTLPGIGAFYELTPSIAMLAGIHKGFSPLGAGAKPDEKPELSVNWEMGIRYSGVVDADVIVFRSDFDNKAEICSVASPCSNGAEQGAFVTGEAVIQGVELSLSGEYELGFASVPVALSFTQTDAEITSARGLSGVQNGDHLAAVPKTMAAIRTGFVFATGTEFLATAKFTDALCVKAGCNRDNDALSQTDSYWSVDLALHHELSDSLSGFVKLENATDERAIVSRQPDGARPNKPQSLIAGFEWRF